MKKILCLSAVVTLIATTGCLVGEDGHYSGHGHERFHEHYEGHADVVVRPVIVAPRPPELIVRPPEIIVR